MIAIKPIKNGVKVLTDGVEIIDTGNGPEFHKWETTEKIIKGSCGRLDFSIMNEEGKPNVLVWNRKDTEQKEPVLTIKNIEQKKIKSQDCGCGRKKRKIKKQLKKIIFTDINYIDENVEKLL